MTFPLPSMAGFENDLTTWSTTDKDASCNLTNNDLDMYVTDSSFSMARANLGRNTGKYYFEIYYYTTAPNSARQGFATSAHSLATYVGASSKGVGIEDNATTVSGWTNAWGSTFYIDRGYSGGHATGDWWGFAINWTSGYAWVHKNGTWARGGDPVAGTLPTITGITGSDTIYPASSGYVDGGARLFSKTSQFLTTLPSGYTQWAG